jgi:tRNA A-37 threonylcarbamoyl transferase component Bud32
MQELVMDRFRVLERIGSGGMGTVYRAYDERLQREVALKEVRETDRDRILREAHAAARLNHPAIVTLYELGEHDGRAVLVSELVPGETLADLEAAGMLCDRDIAEITADLCDALLHAHARGVVHRDIKPQNVIVGDDLRAGRRAKLMDFGIAQITGAPTLTAAGEVVGTLAYMSPEQAEGELAGPQTDVYSLALTAYECWAGLNPVAGRTPAQTARRIGEPQMPLSAHRPDLPEGLTTTIDACLDPDPDLRPTADELADCLRAEIPYLDAVHSLPGHELPDGEQRVRPSPPRAGPLAILGVLTAPLLGAAGLGGGAAALGAAGPGPRSRALLGAGAWLWMLAAAYAFGFGADAGIAGDDLAATLVSSQSLLGALVFAIASVALGWVLSARHVAVALLGAMIWAAGTVAALTAVGDGTLGSGPTGVLIAAAVAVALEYGHPRAGTPAAARSPGPRRASLAGTGLRAPTP